MEALWRSSCDGRRLARGRTGGRASRRGRATDQTPLSAEIPEEKKFIKNADKDVLKLFIDIYAFQIFSLQL
jgi:hypothetical protein